MTHQEKLQWMAMWVVRHNAQLTLESECGFGRECVGILVNDCYPDYQWHNEETYDREDNNGDVWTPSNAYHKADVVAVLGRGEEAEAQLYDWLKWFDDNGFVIETGEQKMDPRLGALGFLLGKHRFQRMVKKSAAQAA